MNFSSHRNTKHVYCHGIEVPSQYKFQMEKIFWNIISIGINITVQYMFLTE